MQSKCPKIKRQPFELDGVQNFNPAQTRDTDLTDTIKSISKLEISEFFKQSQVSDNNFNISKEVNVALKNNRTSSINLEGRAFSLKGPLYYSFNLPSIDCLQYSKWYSSIGYLKRFVPASCLQNSVISIKNIIPNHSRILSFAVKLLFDELQQTQSITS